MLLSLAGLSLAGPGMAAESGADRIASPPPISPRSAGDPVFTPPPAKDGYAYPDCFCVNKGGERTPMGGSACIEIGSTRYTARCGMSLNNPAWRKLRDGCDPGPGVLLFERFERLKPG
ncbi:hypothetical protein [Albimonas donghaensis]|nr:hypothetical protein [Albimonas donghaensis]